MAVKKKSISGTSGGAQKITGAKNSTKTGIVTAVYKLDPATPPIISRPAEKTIEHQLEDKAAAADTKIFTSPSLGQMSREARRKLLFG